MAPRKLKPGDLYEGPRVIDTVDGLTAFFVLNEDGSLGPRLIHVDLAPGNEYDGSEEFRIAAADDPAQQPAPPPGNPVDLEVEGIVGSSSTEV